MLFTIFCICFIIFLGYAIFYIQVDRGRIFKPKIHLERKEEIWEYNSRAKNICRNICAIMMVFLLLFAIFFFIYSLVNGAEYYNLYREIFCVISIFVIIDIIWIFFYLTNNQDGLSLVLCSLLIICLMLCPVFFNSTLSYENNIFGVEQLLCIDEENNIHVKILGEKSDEDVVIVYKTNEGDKEITTKKYKITVEKSEENKITGYYELPVEMNILGQKRVKDGEEDNIKYTIAVNSYDSIHNFELLWK